MIYLVGDPGSTHDGSLEKARELVKIGAGAGLNAVKFQLLGLEQIYKNGRSWEDAHTGKITTAGEPTGNVLLKWEYLPELMDLGKSLGVEVFASVFNRAGAEWLAKIGCKSIKFAYSQKNNLNWIDQSHWGSVFVSGDVMSYTRDLPGEKLVRLYCIPIYPVPYIIDFEGLFPLFNGFSSHCLGYKQEIAAVEAGAKYLEFHFMGHWSSPTPDARFAKSPKLTEQLVKKIRFMEDPMGREIIFKDIPFKSAPAVPFSPDGLGIDHNE